MKKLFTLLAFAITIIATAQAPQGFNYQATVRNSLGQLLLNQIVLVKFKILQNSATGAVVYSENQTANTDDLGHIALVVGQGIATLGTFSNISWANGTYYLGIELNTGTGYVAIGTTQLLSVPYALYAQNSGSTATNQNIQQVLDAGNVANKTVTVSEDASLKINTIGGSTSGSFYYGIKSQIDGTNGNNRAILAGSNGVSLGANTAIASYASNAATNTSIYARAYNATTGSNYGVYGLANGTTGFDNRGVQGTADGVNTVNRNYGTLGFAVNSSILNTGSYGYAYSGTGDNYGVWGVGSNATNGNDNRGVVGYSKSVTPTGKNYGVTGAAEGSEIFNIALGGYSDGVATTSANNFGALAKATSVTTTGTNYGVYGEASNGATNYAGFFNGNVTVTGTFVYPSDRKLKKEIKPFASALDKINALSPVTYYYKSEKESGINLPANLQYGFIAQDLETVFPDLVTNQVLNLATTGNAGNKKASINPDEKELDSENTNAAATPIEKNTKEEFKGINYTGLISVLTQAIKEQQVMIEDLKKQNKSLNTRINRIEKKLKK